MLADRPVPRWLDALALDPTPKGTAIKDAVTVTDNVFWRRVSAMDRSAQETADGATVGAVRENADMNNPT